MKKYLLGTIILGSIFSYSLTANAKIQSKVVEYKDGNTTLEGYIVYDDAKKGKVPGVLVVHEWMGLNDYAKMRVEQIAKMGYVAFAPDIYGKGIRPTTPDAAGKEAGKYKSDRKLMRSRVLAGFNYLKANKMVDNNKTAAIGYCFGGTTALELARSGADLKGVVSFHGGLDTPTPEDAKNIKGKVLALHGGDDPYVPEKDVLAFQSEMRNAKLDWRMVVYGGAVHAFTNPANGTDNSKGAAYNEKADKRSWKELVEFFGEIFK